MDRDDSFYPPTRAINYTYSTFSTPCHVAPIVHYRDEELVLCVCVFGELAMFMYIIWVLHDYFGWGLVRKKRSRHQLLTSRPRSPDSTLTEN